MKVGFGLRQVLGGVYNGGDVAFGADSAQQAAPGADREEDAAKQRESLFSCCGNRVAKFELDLQRNSVLRFEGRGDVRRVCVSADGNLLCAIDSTGYLALVSLTSRITKTVHRQKLAKAARTAAFSPAARVLCVDQGRRLELWRVPKTIGFQSLQLLNRLNGHSGAVTCAAWSPCGTYLVSGSEDMTLCVHRLRRTFQRVGAAVTLTGHREAVIACHFVQDAFELEGLGGAFDDAVRVSGDAVYSVARDAAVYVWAREGGGGGGRGGGGGEAWAPVRRLHVRRNGGDVTAAAFRRRLLCLGYSHGVFGLFAMPTGDMLHALSVAQAAITSCQISASGDLLAIACAPNRQLLVWEWESETHVLKQQGHAAQLRCVCYSPAGRYLASGAEDGALKLWDADSGFCFATFREHERAVTATAFVGNGGRAVVSASLDGTVRAFDLLRYRNFRTLQAPKEGAKLLSVAVDGGGEVVVAGALEPYDVYVWSLQTGKLLDVLSGHEAPVSCLSFGNGSSATVLASGSWDGTVKVWNVYRSELMETFEHPADVLGLSFSPDGAQLAATCLSGSVHVWDVAEARELKIIDASRDARTGALRSAENMSRQNAEGASHFSHVAFSADGRGLIVGGESKFACIYDWEQGALLKKFQLSRNRLVEGVLDRLRDDEESPEEQEVAHNAPLRSAGDDGGRKQRAPRAAVSALCASPGGREWAAATHEGLLVYSLDDDATFEPFQLDEDLTVSSTRRRLRDREFARALAMALQLGEPALVDEALLAVPADDLSVVATALPTFCVRPLLTALARGLQGNGHLEFFLLWLTAVYRSKHAFIEKNAALLRPQLRVVQKAAATCMDDLVGVMRESSQTLAFLTRA